MPATASSILRRVTLLTIALWFASASAFANDGGAHFDAVSAYDEGRYEDALAAIDRATHTSGLSYLRLRVLAASGDRQLQQPGVYEVCACRVTRADWFPTSTDYWHTVAHASTRAHRTYAHGRRALMYVKPTSGSQSE